MSGGAETKPRSGFADYGPSRHIKEKDIVRVAYRNGVGNLFTWPVETTIGVEVDPRIQLRPRGSVLYVDGNASVQLADLDDAKTHSIFIVRCACRVI
ncbi:hypothetical protein Pla52n_62080 [Stieleria varia]|uniref:Uncharacterized protein n=1 Tax=Stieleria varia TaxID=2528005 RepID=A0A5C5ZXH1_9BACT|nr:hypothetical protein Pla52n_62080 [Stieleria varia]